MIGAARTTRLFSRQLNLDWERHSEWLSAGTYAVHAKGSCGCCVFHNSYAELLLRLLTCLKPSMSTEAKKRTVEVCGGGLLQV